MITAEFRLHYSLLQQALENAPSAELEWVRSVREGDRRRAVLWGEQIEDQEALEAGFEADPTCDLERAMGDGRLRLYEVWLNDATIGNLYSAIVETGTIVERAKVDREGWDCRYIFPDEAALDRFFATCRENGISYDIQRMQRSDDGENGEPVLTSAQRAAVKAARTVGYFDVPRGGSLADVADELDISTTAAGHRLRRGLGNLVDHELGRDMEES